MTCSRKDFSDNEENKAIYYLRSCVAVKHVTQTNANLIKIIFLADTIDGLHIRSLLLNVLNILPSIGRTGSLYTLLFLLYGIKKKNKRMVTPKMIILAIYQYLQINPDYIEGALQSIKNHVI